MKLNIFKSILIFATMVIITNGCKSSTNDPYGGSTTTPPKNTTNAVTISGFAFSPSSLTVAKGTTVTWQNNDSALHTATSDSGSWNTGDIAQGATKSVIFNTTGTFAYHCAHHTSMKATIIVN